MSTPVILGLDPSPHRIGWGVVTLEDGAPVACGVVPFAHINPDDWRVWFDRSVRNTLRTVVLNARIVDADVSAVYVEKPGGGRSVQGTLDVAWVAGQIAQAAGRRWNVDVWSFRPQEWKKAVGLKGNAMKDECIAFAREFGFDVPVIGKTTQHYSDDAADAGLIARAGWVELDRAAEGAA